MKKTIYLYTEPVIENAYWLSRLRSGISDFASERRYSVSEAAPDSMQSGGLLLILGTKEEWLTSVCQRCLSLGILAFPVNASIPGDIKARATAVFSLERAVRDCVRYLAYLGSKRPMLVGLNHSSSADQLKRRIFTDEAEKLGITPLLLDDGTETLKATVESFRAVLGKTKADAVLCSNDTAAIILISELLGMGIPVGRSFPVIGMGNSHIGRRMTPSITTVDFDYYSLGREAARLYIYAERLPIEIEAEMSVSLPAPLIIRESTGNTAFSDSGKQFLYTKQLNNYFGDGTSEKIIRLENYLQHCDEIDSELIFCAEESYRSLSERLFASERTLKYRMSNILSVLGLASKNELKLSVEEILKPKYKKNK